MNDKTIACSLPPSPKRPFQFRLRTLLVIFLLVACVISLIAWFYKANLEPMNRWREIGDRIDTLQKKCPPGIPLNQWEVAVGWTHNLHGNTWFMYEDDQSKIIQFQEKLEEKLSGKVDMNTILWIWDQYSQLSEQGKSYQRFKQQMLDDMKTLATNKTQGEKR